MRGFRGVCLSRYGDKNVKIVLNDEFVSVKLDEWIFLTVSSDRLHLKGGRVVTDGFGNYTVGFGNYTVGFGNYDSETIGSDSETTRSDSETMIRKLYGLIRKL